MTTAPFKWRIVDDVVVGVSGSGKVDDQEWSAFIDAIKSTPSIKAYLQYAVGTTELSSVQRRLGFEAVSTMKVALVTGSPLVRGIATAASWFGVKVKAWRPSDIRQAIIELGVAPHKVDDVYQATNELSKGVE